MGRTRSRWSTRTRIVGWLTFLVAVVLLANLLVAVRVLQLRSADRVTGELHHEYDKVAAFAAESARADWAVDDLLVEYLTTAFPEEDEALFTIIDGVPDRRSGNAPPYRLDLDADFVELAASVREPRLGTWSAGGETMRYGVFPVVVPGDSRHAALVVVEFVDDQATRTTMALLAAVTTGALVVAGAVSWFVAGRLLRPIQKVSETAETISESDLSRRIEVHGHDDVADLSLTFNRMLDRIEAAFDAQRSFLDDVSHELRTPLTVVRGQLELMGDDPSERARVEALILGELDRMGRLVDDLLVLARAERPDFLAPGVVSLADLTVDVLAKSRALGDRHWSLSDVATATVMVDGQRITQALMQLVANAVAHTDAGDEIDIGSSVRSDHVALWVRDSGRGIAPGDQQRIFARFETARVGEPGGLGLAIVTSIMTAHGGSVDLVSALGSGSTFTLRLPRTCVIHDDDADDDQGATEDNDAADVAPAGTEALDPPKEQ